MIKQAQLVFLLNAVKSGQIKLLDVIPQDVKAGDMVLSLTGFKNKVDLGLVTEVEPDKMELNLGGLQFINEKNELCRAHHLKKIVLSTDN